MATYLAYPCGKMNQSFWMTNQNYESLFEANLVKFHLLKASDYEFVNKRTLKTVTHQIGKTVTKQQGAGGFSIATSSYFKIDGVNVFEVLEKNGYTFKTLLKFDIFHPELTLIDINTKSSVANFKLNVVGERQSNVSGVGNKQRNIEITTELDDIEVIFLAAFALSRVDFSANTL